MKSPARICRFCKANHGGALVEFAFVFPFLLLLLVGAIDLGNAYFVYIEVVTAAHAGAEYGSRFPTDATGIADAAQNAEPYLSVNPPPNVTWHAPVVDWGCVCSDGSSFSEHCSPTPTCATNSIHRTKVTTSATYTMLMPWAAIPFPYTHTGSSSVTLSYTAVIRGL
jgi:Flp pilus assembly protein TadG